MDLFHRRGRPLRLGATVFVVSTLLFAPALVGEAADPPFDPFVSDACASFGQGPSGEVPIDGQVSVTGTGPLRTVEARFSFRGVVAPDDAANVCIARNDTVFASVTQLSLTTNEFTATFTVGLGLSDPDLAIDSGERVCNVAVVFVGADIGVSDAVCTDPIDLPLPPGPLEPLPPTGRDPHTAVVAGGLLALLIGAAALVLSRRPT